VALEQAAFFDPLSLLYGEMSNVHHTSIWFGIQIACVTKAL